MGSPTYISYDLLDEIYWSGALAVPVSHLATAPDAISAIEKPSAEGLSVQMHNRKSVIIATNRDVNLYEFDHYVSFPPVTADAVKCRAFTGGARTITTAEYLNAVEALRPDAVVPIAYQAPLDY